MSLTEQQILPRGRVSHSHHNLTKTSHLSFLHQPLPLRSIQTICFLQKSLFKRVLINLTTTGSSNREDYVTHTSTTFTSGVKSRMTGIHLTPRTSYILALSPAGRTACSADSSADCGRWLLRFSPALSATESHQWFYSEPSGH